MWKSKTTRPGYVAKQAESLKKIREEEAKTESESEVEESVTETDPEADEEFADPHKASSGSIKFRKTKRINKIEEANQNSIVVKISRPKRKSHRKHSTS